MKKIRIKWPKNLVYIFAIICQIISIRGVRMIKPRIGKLLRVSKYKREFIIQELDISKNTLSNWIAGNTYPTIDKAFLLADLLEVSVDDLYERNKGPND
jgi:transcriptional regulator with XRE-family HTH domain